MKATVGIIFLIVMFSVLFAGTAHAGCMTDQGAYKDGWGFTRFPFYNNCNKTVSVSVCAKSYPNKDGYPVYNRYSATSYGKGSVEMTNGKWKFFHSYRWAEDAVASCSF